MQERVDIWLDPWRDIDGDGYQIAQAAFAMASGGLTGTGLGLSNVGIPLVESDFIFASVAEQLGLLGATVILTTFLMMIGSGLRIATRTVQPFEKLLATGLTALLGIQAFIIIGGVTRVLPLTGVTLPFVSYGGSSLVANYVLLALLLRISDQNARPPAPRGDASPSSRVEVQRVNKQIRRLGLGLVACYVALFAMLNWVQVIKADDYNNHPLNTAKVRQEFNRERGTITSADGALLAISVDNPDTGVGSQAHPQLSRGDLFGQVTGFFSFWYGSTGVERSYTDELSGQTLEQQVRGFADLFVDRKNVGNVTVSVRKDLQQVSRDALGPQEGSVVAIDVKTGELLSFWSYPSYDPNLLAGLDKATVDRNWALLNLADGAPLRPHQYQDRYFPGSTFKVVTGLDRVAVGQGHSGATRVSRRTQLHAAGHARVRSTTSVELRAAARCFNILRVSCNTAFARWAPRPSVRPT